jgi:hypothetical protein
MSEIVSAFKPPPPSPPPDGFLKEYFERDVETVLDFCNQHKGSQRINWLLRSAPSSSLASATLELGHIQSSMTMQHITLDMTTQPQSVLPICMKTPSPFVIILSEFNISHHYTGLQHAWTLGNLASVSTQHRFREDQRAWDYPLPDCMKKGGDLR